MDTSHNNNEYRKVLLHDIVFLQGDDFSEYAEKSPESDLNYLLQWYNGENNITGEYYAR
jgi:hypothetical protein